MSMFDGPGFKPGEPGSKEWVATVPIPLEAELQWTEAGMLGSREPVVMTQAQWGTVAGMLRLMMYHAPNPFLKGYARLVHDEMYGQIQPTFADYDPDA